MIGQYGIGFLSAFLIGDRIDVYTRRSGEDEGWHWWCEGSEDYHIEPAADLRSGTKVAVRLLPQDKLPPEFADNDGLKKMCRSYGSLLQVPIRAGGLPVNPSALFWKTAEQFRKMTEAEMREFLLARFPVEFLDVFGACLNADHMSLGSISFRAALFFSELSGSDFLIKNTQFGKDTTGIDVYVRGMFVARVGDLMPSWASFVHGAVDFDRLNLNLSRENIREDRLYEALQEALGRKVLDRLREISGTDKLRKIVEVHQNDLLQACLLHGERKFSNSETFLDFVFELLPWKTTHGTRTMREYQRDLQDAGERFRHCVPGTVYWIARKTSGAAETILAEDMGWPVVLASPIQIKILEKIQSQRPNTKLRALTADEMIDGFREATSPHPDDGILRVLFEDQLQQLNVSDAEVRVRRFRASYPALLLDPGGHDPELQEMLRLLGGLGENNPKMAEALRKLEAQKRHRAGKVIFYVNAANSMVQNLLVLCRQNPNHTAVGLAARTLYNSAFLHSSHESLSPDNSRALIENFNDAIQTVLTLVLEKSAVSQHATSH